MLSFYQVGGDVAADARRMAALYSDAGIDARIEKEFEGTVAAYTSLSMPEIEERIAHKYVDGTEALGVVAVKAGADVGMAVAGLKEFAIRDTQPQKGINVSGWILEQYRGRGYSILLGSYMLARAFERSRDPGFPDWYNAPIWTSIHHENAPSIAAAQRNGFTEVGVAANDTDRRIFLFE